VAVFFVHSSRPAERGGESEVDRQPQDGPLRRPGETVEARLPDAERDSRAA
jgi:hypothetical protein